MMMTPRQARKTKSKGTPYKLIKIQTPEGKPSTVSVDKSLYDVIESRVGAAATITVVRQAASKFDPAKHAQTRSSYVVDTLFNKFGIGRPSKIEVRSKSKVPSASRKYTYAKRRVLDADGNVTTVSLPPALISRAQRTLSDEQVKEVIRRAAAAYDPSMIFTRSEYTKRALKIRIGEKVPSELRVFRRKFRLSNVQLAAILQMKPEELAEWEERDEVPPGPARMMISALWRDQLKLSAVLPKG